MAAAHPIKRVGTRRLYGSRTRSIPGPAQGALQWLLQLAPNVLLIPGTGSIAHLRENLAAEGVMLDDEALRTLDGVAG
jgi:aryl-alcohol dehydrogenase-like predicted oxidoreductase